MKDPFDLLVIGSGTAAQTAASRVRKAGWRVAVVDHRPLGGTCALRGCDPKKMLVSGEEALDAAHRMSEHGVAGAVRIDWPGLMAFKRSFTGPIPEKQAARYAELGVEVFHGVARFIDPETVEIEDRAVKARHVLLATGARPVPLEIPGAELITSSDDFLELPVLPRRVVFVGGGYIATEFAHLAARAGADVTVLQRGPRLLPQFEADVVDWLMPSFAALGVRIETHASVVAIERDGLALRVRASRRAGRPGGPRSRSRARS